MSEENQQTAIDLGIYSKAIERSGMTSTEVIALVLSIVWLLGVTMFFVFAGGTGDGPAPKVDSLRFVMTLIAVFMPIALIWVAASAARSSRIMKEESARLQAAINAMRHSYLQQQQSGAMGVKPSFERKRLQRPSARPMPPSPHSRRSGPPRRKMQRLIRKPPWQRCRPPRLANKPLWSLARRQRRCLRPCR